MAKYLDYVAFISESQGANDSLKIRDTEARTLIQNNTNNIANLDAREQVDAAAIAANAAKNTEQDARLAVAEGAIEQLQDRVTATEQKNTQQDGRLDVAETDIDNLQTRMTAAEAKNTEQDGRLDTVETEVDDLETRMTAAEAKNAEQDDRITSNSNRLTTAETDIDNLETRMTAAEEKDAEQDQHLSDLDDAVAASTYEAGVGIYFGEGVHHTNINVDDEILAQIEQNRININILTQTKTELYDVNESTGDRINYPQLEIGPTLNVYNGKIDGRSYEVQFYFGADYTTLQGSANEVSAVVDKFFRNIHYTGTNDSYPYSGVLMARISSTMAENDEATYIPAVVTTHISAFYPAWIDMFVRDREGHPWLLSARVDGVNIAPVIVSKRLSEYTDIEGINTRITALEGRMTTAEADIDAAQADITTLTGRMSSAESTIAGHTTDIAGLTTRMNVAENTLTRVDGQTSQNTNDIDRLDQHMTAAEADIDAAQADITTLTGRMSNAESTIAGHTTDIAGLLTRMTAAETDIAYLKKFLYANAESVTTIPADREGVFKVTQTNTQGPWGTSLSQGIVLQYFTGGSATYGGRIRCQVFFCTGTINGTGTTSYGIAIRQGVVGYERPTAALSKWECICGAWYSTAAANSLLDIGTVRIAYNSTSPGNLPSDSAISGTGYAMITNKACHSPYLPGTYVTADYNTNEIEIHQTCIIAIPQANAAPVYAEYDRIRGWSSNGLKWSGWYKYTRTAL